MRYEPTLLVDSVSLREVKRGSRRRSAAIVAASLAGVVALAAWLYPGPGAPTVPVKRGEIVHSVVAVGRVESEEIVEVVPRSAGRIEAVPF